MAKRYLTLFEPVEETDEHGFRHRVEMLGKQVETHGRSKRCIEVDFHAKYTKCLHFTSCCLPVFIPAACIVGIGHIEELQEVITSLGNGGHNGH